MIHRLVYNIDYHIILCWYEIPRINGNILKYLVNQLPKDTFYIFTEGRESQKINAFENPDQLNLKTCTDK